MKNSQPDRPTKAPTVRPAEPPFAATCDYLGGEAAEELVRVLDQYLDDLKHGRTTSRAELIAKHPALASQLEACLAGLDFIHGVQQATPGHLPQLGDFRIIREVGRGGMGAVFEAEQISLGRRVALKVLRFGGVSDKEALDRFQREAETVAKLHHTHIVPIFAVGSESGVNYYAMQFIDGQSLAEVLAERRSALSPTEAAEIGLQAADALAHAHQRGVVHRDVKPSNLLIDHENRVWLTDFGLARRLDDVTLSMTGALLGTPRYMSPEQAQAATKRVDFRSDLFSLGATLYELLSGNPAFCGDSPHEVIQHILCDEPAGLRTLDPLIPRDLETIVMKCLVKDPQHRYANASDLAADLRAFLDGRPIRARRATPVEVAVRWVKRHRRSTMLAFSAAAFTALLILVGSFGQAQYIAWRQATVQLAAVRPPIVAEIFDREGQLLRTDTLPMQKPVSLPADEYEVRLSAEGKLSQTYTLELERGQSTSATATLDNDYLFPPHSLQRSYDIVDLGSETGIVFWTEDSVALRKTNGPAYEWTRELNNQQEFCQSSLGFQWPWSSPLLQYSGYGSYRYQPWVMTSFLDVNQDGVGDIIAAARHQAWVMAISGADGNVLWFAPRSEQLAHSPTITPSTFVHNYRSAVISEPLLMGDLDEDGVEDVVVTILDVPSSANVQGYAVAADRWIEAISGATGQTIWRHNLPSHLFDLPAGNEVPYDLRWFVGSAGGMSSSGRSSSTVGRHLSRSRGRHERTGIHVYLPTPPMVVSHATQIKLACVAGTHLIMLDPLTGHETESPIDLGVRAGLAPQWADVDRDGSSDLVLLEAVATAANPQTTTKLHVWSSTKQDLLWSQSLDADWPQQPNWTVAAPRWPLVVDLPSSGQCAIVVPHRRSNRSSSAPTTSVDTTPWGELLALNGSTGSELWSQRLVSIDSQIDHFVSGPDLDGDGMNDIFVATMAGRNFSVYVDALSGADGRPLWTESFEPRNARGLNGDLVLGPLNWWNSGPDGWPQLLVQLSDQQGPTPQSLVCTFSAGTGKLSHYGYGLNSAYPHDLDRDGLQELLLLKSRSATRSDFGGELTCLRGRGRQFWKRFGELGQPIADLDGDGVLDLVRSWGDGTLLASSGLTGRLLWRHRPVPAVDAMRIMAAKRGDASDSNRTLSPEVVDLDGDGIGDLLAWEPSSGGRGSISPLHAISGRSGQLIWTLSDVSARITNTLAIACEDLDGDGRVEVMWLAALDHNYPTRFGFSSNDAQLWLFVAAGKTGRLLWSQPLSPAYGHSVGQDSPFQFQRVDLALAIGDLNRDGFRDILTPAISETGQLELRSLSGNDGQLLWTRDSHPDGLSQESLRHWTAPTVADLNGDGRIEVVCVEPSLMQNRGGTSQQNIQISMLAGSNGSEIWSHDTDVAFTHYQSFGEKLGQLLRPVRLRVAAGKQQAGIFLPGGNSKFVSLDYNGLVQERICKNPPRGAEVWVCDKLASGVDAVVFLDDNHLSIFPADQLDHPLWQRKLETGQTGILAIRAGGPAVSPEIVMSLGATDNSVIGIDASTGSTKWSCAGPIVRDLDDGVYIVPSRIAFLGNGADAAPLITYSTPHVSECRQAVMRETVFNADRGGDVSIRSKQPPQLAVPGAIDVRWQRALPWVAELELSRGRVASFITWGLFFSLTMIVVPGVYAAFTISQRKFGLRTLMGLPIVVLVFLLAALVAVPPEDNDFRNVVNRLMVGIGFAPPLLTVALWLKQLAARRVMRVIFWGTSVVIVTGVWAAVQLWVSVTQSPLLPQESFDWSG
jgi:serine/threonine protein kinase/outer membrane protein assembly factor BamB